MSTFMLSAKNLLFIMLIFAPCFVWPLQVWWQDYFYTKHVLANIVSSSGFLTHYWKYVYAVKYCIKNLMEEKKLKHKYYHSACIKR